MPWSFDTAHFPLLPHETYADAYGSGLQAASLPCRSVWARPNTQDVLCVPQVKAKDIKLKQLRGAIKALEEKLAQLLKDKVDM